MFTFQKSGSGKYLKHLLVALIVVGLMGMYIIPQHFTYGGQGDKNKVEFFDFNNVLLSEQTIDYGQGATPPPDSAANVPEGYDFLGWSNDYTYVTGPLLIWPMVELTNMPGSEEPQGMMSAMEDIPEDFAFFSAASDEAPVLVAGGADLSDLTYFIDPDDGLVIRDLTGAIPAEYYFGEEYVFTIGYTYPQDVIYEGTKYWAKPKPRDDGFLYYQLPAGIAVRSDSVLEGTLTRTNDNGEEVEIEGGKYWIIQPTAENPITEIKVQLPAEMLAAAQGGFDLKFNASFEGSTGDGPYFFRDGVSVSVKEKPEPEEPPIVIVDDSEMTVEKTGGVYNHADQSLTYTIKINATKGNPKFNHTYDWVAINSPNINAPAAVIDHRDNPITINKTTLNGDSILTDNFPRIAYYNTWHGEGSFEFWFTDGSKGSDFGLTEGDEIIIEYTVSIGEPGGLLDKAGFGYDLNLVNCAMTFWDDEPTGPSTVPTRIKRDFEKRAEYYEAPNGDRSIKWSIYIGDGKTDLRGKTIEELLDPRGLEAETAYNVLLRYYDAFDLAAGGITGAVLKEYENPSMEFDQLFDPDTGFVIGDFYDDQTKGIYYVFLEFTSRITDNLAPKFSNGILFDGKYSSGAGHAGVPGVYKDIHKSGNLIEAGGNDYLEWNIDYTVPAGIQGSSLWFYDRMMIGSFVPFNNREALLADGVVVTITNTDFPGGKELTEGTDYVLKSNGSEAWEIHLIDPESNSGKWPYSIETTINITYRLNLDNALAAGGGSIRDALKAVAQNKDGAHNTVHASIILPGYEGEGGYTITVSDDDRVRYPINKGRYNDDANEIQYFIDINFDGKYSLPEEPLLVRDTFNSDILAYNGNLMVQKFAVGSSTAIGTYTADSGAESTIRDNRNGTSTITFDLGAGYWSEPWYTPGTDFRYVIFYNMILKDDAPPGVHEVKNTAGVRNNSYTSTSTNTVGKPIASKNMVGDRGVDTGASVDVELIFNAEKLTYSEGMPYLAEDVMSDNLFLREDTIVFEKQTASGGWEKIDATYTYLDHNLVNFMIPDRETIKVTYSAYVLGANGQQSPVENTVTVFGHGYTKKIDNFRLQRLTGNAYFQNNSLSMLKRDSLSDDLMPDITFAVYINKNYDSYNANDPRWAGVAETLKVIDGEEYRIIDVGTTGPDGHIAFEKNEWFADIKGVVFAIFEISRPEGYLVPAVTTPGGAIHEGFVRLFTFNMDTATFDKGNPYQVMFSLGPVSVPNVPLSTEVTIGGTKQVEGIDGTNHSGYAFKLIEVTDQTGNEQKMDVVPRAGLTATSGPGGSFSFASIPNLRAGDNGTPKTYYFKVQEVVPDTPIPNMVYDTAPRVVKVTVQSGENGNLDVNTEWTGKGRTFVNKLLTEVEPVSVELKAIKTAAGASLTGIDFKFILYTMDSAGEKSEKGEYGSYNAQTGYVTFETLEFEEPGLYKYLMVEGDTELPGWSIDKTGYFFEINVEEETGRQLSATVKYQYKTPYDNDFALWLPAENVWVDYDENEGAISTWPGFVNEYTPQATSTTIVANKSVTGAALTAGQFRFALLDSDGTVVDLATNAADGTITFNTPTYTSVADTITYTIVECGLATATTDWVVGSPAGPYKTTTGGGWTYDSSEYTVSVSVADNAAVLSAAVTYPDGSVSFTNEYTPGKARAVISGDKTITGITGSSKTFGFTAVEVESATSDEPVDGGITKTGTRNGSGAFTIPLGELDAGVYHFIVTEDRDGSGAGGWAYDESSFRVTVTVTDSNGKATVAYDYYGIENPGFTNSYSPGTATAVVEGTKTVTGATGAGITFSFNAVEVTGQGGETPVVGGKTGTGSRTGAGDFTISITDLSPSESPYYFMVSESRTGTGNGWTYDTGLFWVTVTVTDDGNGNAAATVAYDGAEIVFDNIYGSKGEAELTGDKSISGIAGTTKEFTFNAVEVGAVNSTTPVTNPRTGTATRTGSGSFTIELGTLAVGTYVFMVTEADDSGAGWLVNEQTFWATVVMTDAGNGTATPTVTYSPAETMTFTNTYTSQGAAQLAGSKSIEGADGTDREFTFNAVQVASVNSTTPVADPVTGTATRTGSGPFSIGLGTLPAGNYVFMITEEDGSGAGWTYSSQVYWATVVMKDNGNGTATPTVTYSPDTPMTFTNTYKAIPANTTLTVTKALTGIDNTNAAFSFTAVQVVSATDRTPVPDGKTGTGSVTGAGDVTIAITGLVPDTYYFLITEVTGNAGGFKYSEATVIATVVVEDNGDGTSTALAPAYSPNAATFTNEYKAAPTNTTLTVTKALAGIGATDAAFGFTAVQVTSPADRTPVPGGKTGTGSVTGAGNATIAITGLVPGTYYFVITEDAGSAGGFAYSDAEILATVVVTDNGNGTSTALAATYTPDARIFTNAYSAAGSLELEGSKSINDSEGATWPVTPFTFTVTDVTDEDSPRVVAAGANGSVTAGTIAFDPIGYLLNEDIDETGRYVYVISEDAAGDGWTAKTSVITIYVEVVDDGEGALVATAYSDELYSVPIEDISAFLAFENEYVAEGSITLTGAKVLGISVAGAADTDEPYTFVPQTNQTMAAGQFKFSVLEGDTEVATGENLAGGTIAFTEIVYTLADLGLHTYVITETYAGPGFSAFNETLTVTVMVTDNGDGTLTAEVVGEPVALEPVEEGGEGNTEPAAATEQIVFENVRWYDAALRKWVSAVNPVDTKNIDTAGIGESNKNADAGTPSPAVKVNVGDQVEYTIRVFNQSPWPLMVTGVVDDLPAGLGFVAGNPADENPVNAGWSLVGGKLRFEWPDPEDIPVLSPQISRFAGVDGYEDFDFGFGPDEQDDNPYYYDLYVILEVLPAAKAGEPITNSAMITGIKDEDGNDVEDIDSDFDESKLDDPDADDNNVEGDGLNGGDRDEHDIAIVYIEGRISVEVDKDTIKRTSAAFNGEDFDVLDGENGEIIDNVGIENYRYDVNFRSTSNIDVDEFVVDDPLEAVAEGFVRIENLWTPSTWGDMDGRMAVWYKAAKGDASAGIDIPGDPGITKVPTGGELLFPTNRSEGWKLWAVISDSAWTEESPIINRVNLGLPFEPGDDDYITALRFEYGAVQVGFTSKNGDKFNMNNGIRDTNGSKGFYGDVIQAPEIPGGTGAFSADPQAYTDVSDMSAVTAFAAEPLSQAFTIAQTSYIAQQSNAFSDIPGKGETSDWGPEKGRSDFPAEPRNIMSASLKPATYLVSATVPMIEADIVSSAIAYIALNGAIEEAEATAAGKTVGAFATLYDFDQDAVLTRVITPIEVKVQETNIDPLESSESFLERARLMGLEIREDGLWYDANGRRVQTGDVFAISFWLILLACAGICVVLLIRTVVVPPGRKAKKKDPIPESGKGGGQ